MAETKCCCGGKIKHKFRDKSGEEYKNLIRRLNLLYRAEFGKIRIQIVKSCILGTFLADSLYLCNEFWNLTNNK